MPRPNKWPEIVRAAAEVFRERGFEGATVEDVAARVGILKGSLYNYIDTKEDLLFAVVEEPANELLQGLEEMLQCSDKAPTDQLRFLFRTQIRIFYDFYPAAFVYLQHAGRPSNRASFREMDARYVALVEQIIEKGQSNGDFSLSATPAITARAVIGMLDWMAHWFVPDGDLPAELLADQLFALAVGGLTSAGGVFALTTGRSHLPAATYRG